MSHSPNNSIFHFTHPWHPLTSLDCHQSFRCHGCNTSGTGKRFRCHVCDFNLHEYCGTCPPILNSFMHQNHALTLMTATPSGGATATATRRVCDICADPVDGLFYHCRQCEFHVHPLCTQLPERLSHPLHNIHDLSLEFCLTAGFCRVCGGYGDGWRYRCRGCRFDIHIGCLLPPVIPSQGTGGTTPMFNGRNAFPAAPSPSSFPNYYYHACALPPGHVYPNYGSGLNYMYPHNFGAGFNYMFHGQPYMHPPNFNTQNQINGYGNNGGSLGSRIFSIVRQLSLGIISNMMFENMFSG